VPGYGSHSSGKPEPALRSYSIVSTPGHAHYPAEPTLMAPIGAHILGLGRKFNCLEYSLPLPGRRPSGRVSQ